MADGQLDINLMKHTQDYAAHLKAQHAERNTQNTRMDNMYLLTWSDEETVKQKMKGVKITKSPDARNTIIGASRLLIATDPVFSVPRDKNDAEANTAAEPIEKAASQIWQRAGRVRGAPIQDDVVLSMLLYAEAHIAVTRTSDLVEATKGASKAAQARAEEIAANTPFIFDVWAPSTGYPDLDSLGLRAYYREVTTTAGYVLDTFGDDARRALGSQDDRYANVVLCQFWDLDTRQIWLSGGEPIRQEANPYPFIPIVVQLGEGSQLFSKPEQQRQPFLYTLDRTGLWERQNLALTVLYTHLFGIGANPQFLFRTSGVAPDAEPDVDWDVPGGRIRLRPGEEFAPLAKNAIDPSLLQGLEIANQKVPESTIFPQALGQSLGGNAPYSLVALLSQAGRLPLAVPQKKSGWGIAKAMQIALAWYRETGEQHPSIDLKPAEVSQHMELEAQLEVSLPQDRLQNANIATMLTKDNTTSMQWVRENVLKIEQSDEMDKRIFKEKASQAMAMLFIQDQLPKLFADMNQQPQPGGAAPQDMPAEQPPMQGGLPPDMAEGGMAGPEQLPMEGGMPMEEGGANAP